MNPAKELFTQNSRIPIRLVSPAFGHLPPEDLHKYNLTHRKSYYFFLFMLEGHTSHGVDLEQYDVGDRDLLFVLPHQIHDLPSAGHGKDYFKLGFDEKCLSLLPKQYPFLVNPFNRQKITFNADATVRLKSTFEILLSLLREHNTEPDLIIAHLNSLLTEINAVYFSTGKNPADDKLSKYIRFKLFVEDNLGDPIKVSDIARELALNTNSLYQMVKHYSGLSPKNS
jgi:AraC family transcriptional activator of pobA